MNRSALSMICGLAFVGLAMSVPALADRAPTPEERTRIEAAVRAAGYTSWEEIELDDGVWEVDDAVDAEGKQWDLKLDPKTMTIIKRVQD
jgi:hypothetical protein